MVKILRRYITPPGWFSKDMNLPPHFGLEIDSEHISHYFADLDYVDGAYVLEYKSLCQHFLHRLVGICEKYNLEFDVDFNEDHLILAIFERGAILKTRTNRIKSQAGFNMKPNKNIDFFDCR